MFDRCIGAIKDRWVDVKVDGKYLGTLPPSRQTNREIERLNGLRGISITLATATNLISKNASTQISKRLQNTWKRAYKKAGRE